MEPLRKIFWGTSKLGNVIASVLLAGITLLMVTNIIGRYLFNSPISGTWEIVTALMAVLATIGFAFALVQERHIRVTILVNRLPLKARPYMLIFACFIGSIVAGVLCWQLLLMAIHSISIMEYTPGIIHVPIYVPRTIFVFSVLLLCLGYILLLVENIRKLRR